MPFIKKIYLTIPINNELGICDIFLKNALEVVAKAQGFANGKKYLKSKLNCSGASVKHMTKTKPTPRFYYLDKEEYSTKDAYCNFRKIDIEKYADVIKLIVSEYSKIVTKSERGDIFEYISNFEMTPPSYQNAFCYKAIDGLKMVLHSIKTANKINRIDNSKVIAENIKSKLFENNVEVKV